ncbi:E3 ubiquitin-protein ligase RNF14 [Dichanthelium oligosanthes]|uniref:RBR-type E3 ubiquitin transferase n=1 Tax=Dichanthelium oligosanthes TaxID=888268 RepID=A0A1E5ULQ6_9POAL|nr:E3 ubiquitin-protein ligase RNF14 [Dichanthelium oligosanthes]
MPRKSSKGRGAAARGPVGLPAGPRPALKAGPPNPSPAAELPQAAAAAVADAEGVKVPGSGASAAAEALERLHVGPASDGDPPSPPPSEPEPEPEPEAPAPPVEASSSGRSAAGGSLEEEAVRKLHELAEAVGEEVALTEEEVRANDQRQEDEICALEAIFGNAVVILDRKGGQRCFQVHVHIEIPDAIDVSTRLDYGDGTLKYGATSGADADDLVYKFRVEHLPPVLLTCFLPSSYPSHRPPFFTISTYWLDKGMISVLCHMLDTLWEGQQGMEVTYQWVQWLQSSSLSHLGFGNEIVLGKNDVACDADERACLDTASPDVIIPRMMRYNDNKHHEAFLHAIHDCMICFSECPGVDFIKLPCHHFFCWKCMQTYCKMNVKEGNVVRLLCPDTKCEGAVPPNILKRLLGEEEFERWEGLLLQKTLDAMSDVVYCPRCQTACLEDGPFCLCSLHSLLFHDIVGILNFIFIQNRQKSGQVQGDQMKILEELRSLKEIMKDSKQCPKCKMAISKTEGCNKMHCGNCGEYFCYQCNRAITGYEHFKGSCVLFPQEELDRWEMQMNQRVRRQVVAQAHAEMHAQHGQAHPCPTCRQPSPKVGNNNHLFCWACQKHFCALCHKPVPKPAQHYGPKGCKQHSADP